MYSNKVIGKAVSLPCLYIYFEVYHSSYLLSPKVPPTNRDAIIEASIVIWQMSRPILNSDSSSTDWMCQNAGTPRSDIYPSRPGGMLWLHSDHPNSYLRPKICEVEWESFLEIMVSNFGDDWGRQKHAGDSRLSCRSRSPNDENRYCSFTVLLHCFPSRMHILGNPGCILLEGLPAHS